MNMCSTSPACAVLIELTGWDGVKVIADAGCAGLPSTSEDVRELLPVKRLKR